VHSPCKSRKRACPVHYIWWLGISLLTIESVLGHHLNVAFAVLVTLYSSALSTMKRGVVAQKRGQEPIVRSTLRAIWLLVPDPFSEP